MNEIIYLEADEEITSVIDRLRKAKHNCLALVVPRGGTLAQSIVNLKLLKKSASEMGKEISLVANDRISRNLASQIGLTVYSKAGEAEKAGPIEKKAIPAEDPKGDFKVNSYYGKEKDLEEEAISDNDETVLDDDTESDALDKGATSAEIGDKEESVENSDDDEPEKIEKEEIKKSYKEQDEDIHKQPAEINKFAGEKTAELNHNSGSNRKENDSNGGGDNMKKPMSKNKKIFIGIISGCVVLLLAVAYFFLPYASAKVIVKTEDLDISETVTINPIATAIDREKLVIPATTIEIEKEVTKNYKTTGTKELGEKATGKITIYNEWDDKPKTIPAGTKFAGDSGKVFISSLDATVPGMVVSFAPFNKTAGKIDVSVIALETGESYNIGPSHFSISSVSNLQGLVYGQSASAMTGGTTKTVKIVSDADFKTAEEDLTKSIGDLGKTELAAKAKDEKVEIIESKITSELLSKEASKNLNDEAESFDYRVKMKLSVMVYNTEDLKTVMTASAEKNLASEKMLIGQDKFEVSAELIGDVKVAEEGTESGAVEVKGTLKGKTGQKISDKEIKDKIKNKKYAEAIAIIQSYDKVDSVVLEIWPSSIARVPMITNRIRVIFDYAN